MGNDQAKVVNPGEGNVGLYRTFQLFIGFEIEGVRGTTFPHAPQTKQNTNVNWIMNF